MKLSTSRHRCFLLWLLFSLAGVVGILEYRALTTGPILDSFRVSFVLQLLLLFFHSAWTMSWPRSLLFIAIIMGVGLIAELLGVRYGLIFGGFYTYSSTIGTVAGVPLLVLLYWACFAHMADKRPYRYGKVLDLPR